MKNDIYLLQDVLRIPDEITCYNRTKVDGIEGLCIFLKRFAYPCGYSDMIPHFSRSVQELCLVSNAVMNSGVVAGGGGGGQSPPCDNFLGALKSQRGAKVRNSNVKYDTKYVKSSLSTNSKILKHLMARVQTAFY